MNAILAALLAAVVPVLLSWFQSHVLPHSAGMQAMPKDQLRATARAWVLGLLNEIGTTLIKTGLVPSQFVPLLNPLEVILDEVLESALDKAGL